MAALFQPYQSLDSTMGAIFIGVLISAVLHGVTLIQAYNYFTSHPSDALCFKILVTMLVLSDAAHLGLMAQIVYYNLITTYYDHGTLNSIPIPLSIPIQSLLVILNANIVQCYYALRAWQLGKSKPLLLLIVVLILSQNACAVACAIITMQAGSYGNMQKLTSLVVATSSLSATTDVTIAARLIVLLHRFRTGLNRSDKLINKIILFIVSTGLLTSLCATCSVVFVAAFPRAFVGAAFYTCLGRLYTNSFIAALNGRSPVTRTDDGTNNQLTSVQNDILTACISIDKS